MWRREIWNVTRAFTSNWLQVGFRPAIGTVLTETIFFPVVTPALWGSGVQSWRELKPHNTLWRYLARAAIRSRFETLSLSTGPKLQITVYRHRIHRKWMYYSSDENLKFLEQLEDRKWNQRVKHLKLRQSKTFFVFLTELIQFFHQLETQDTARKCAFRRFDARTAWRHMAVNQLSAIITL